MSADQSQKHLIPQRWRPIWNALTKRPILLLALIFCLLATIYWCFIASDRYVSSAHIVIQRTDLASSQAMDFGALLTGGGQGSRADQLLLREHLLSIDMLNKLDQQLQLRSHFSDTQYDPISRLLFKKTDQENFHRYFLSRVSAEYDDYAGVLVIKAEAFEPKMAQAIVRMMVSDGEQFMNALGHQLANDQVRFLEGQVESLNARVTDAAKQLMKFQNKNKMVSPQNTAENYTGIINTLQAQLSELNTQKTAMASYLQPGAPALVEIDSKIAAVEQQMGKEKAQLASPQGGTLNQTVFDFKILEGQLKLAEEVYRTALIGLEKGRIEASRNIKKVSILQAPSLPEYPLQPRRIYNTFASVMTALIIAGIAQLLISIIRDHKD